MTYLSMLEAESIHIIREVVSETEKPVMLYSIGKDSSVMLHLAKKAFFPSRPPFPLMHIDTTWKFQDMYKFRNNVAKKNEMELIIYQNPEAKAQGINPFDNEELHTDIWKTEGLKQALNIYKFDAAFGGARRDEEKSRAKERIFSFRNSKHHWNPKEQRPELWSIFNARKSKGENIRVFPLSNWTELDIWKYIEQEKIEIVPLYFAKQRLSVVRNNMILMLDDNRFPIQKDEIPKLRSIRFRTLGCYPLTGAIESNAKSVNEVIKEMALTSFSEREGRMIDKNLSSSMEIKKQQGYF